MDVQLLMFNFGMPSFWVSNVSSYMYILYAKQKQPVAVKKGTAK